MKTRIIFKYSWIYDQQWKKWIKLYDTKIEDYPSTEEVLSYIDNIKGIWQKDEKRILEEISRFTKLKWGDRDILCYIVGNCIPFSDPLTMGTNYDEPSDFVDMLTHELIHEILDEADKSCWEYIYRKYKKESQKVKNHIPVHAVHSHVLLTLFGKERLEKSIKFLDRLPDYKRSWDIVLRDGYENIIENFLKG